MGLPLEALTAFVLHRQNACEKIPSRLLTDPCDPLRKGIGKKTNHVPTPGYRWLTSPYLALFQFDHISSSQWIQATFQLWDAYWGLEFPNSFAFSNLGPIPFGCLSLNNYPIGVWNRWMVGLLFDMQIWQNEIEELNWRTENVLKSVAVVSPFQLLLWKSTDWKRTKKQDLHLWYEKWFLQPANWKLLLLPYSNPFESGRVNQHHENAAYLALWFENWGNH